MQLTPFFLILMLLFPIVPLAAVETRVDLKPKNFFANTTPNFYEKISSKNQSLMTTENFFIPEYEDPKFVQAPKGNIVMTILGFSLKLAVVIVLIYFTVLMLKKAMLNRKGITGDSAKLIQILDHHYFGPKASIQLVEIGADIIVVGVTSENISLLYQVQDEESKALIRQKEVNQKGFNKYLTDFIRKTKSGETLTVEKAEARLRQDTATSLSLDES